MKPSTLSDERMGVIAVPRVHAEDLRRTLQAHNLVDRTLRITKRDGDVLIPVIAEPPFDLAAYRAKWEADRTRLRRRPSSRDPRSILQEALVAAGIRPELAPHRWKRIGDVLVLRMPPEARHLARAMAEIYGTVLGARTVVEDRSGIHGRLRTPDVRVLWGDGTETVHVEGGVRYAIDVALVMLSPGNLEERLRIPERVNPESVVVDLFAGIGYFTLPIAIRGRAKAVYACELNPTSYAYLLRNIRLNRATNVIPREGDCRDVAPRGVADWVIMGHFDARDYLDVAFAALRGKGTIVYHELCPKEQYPDALTRRLAAAARANWRNVRSVRTRIVKSYAPGILHAAAEVEVFPQARAGSKRNAFER